MVDLEVVLLKIAGLFQFDCLLFSVQLDIFSDILLLNSLAQDIKEACRLRIVLLFSCLIMH